MNQDNIKQYIDVILRNSHSIKLSWFRNFSILLTSLETVKEENIKINMNYYSKILSNLLSTKKCDYVRRAINEMKDELDIEEYSALNHIFNDNSTVTKFIKEVIYYITNDYFIYDRHLLISLI